MHTTRLPTTGRISPTAAGRHILSTERIPLRADIIFLKKKSTRPTYPDSLTGIGLRASRAIPGPFFL